MNAISTNPYENAIRYAQISFEKWNDEGAIGYLEYTIPARVAFLVAAIVNALFVPFAFIKASFGVLYALSKWDRMTPFYQEAKTDFHEKYNRVFFGIVGTIAPKITHLYGNNDVAPYVMLFAGVPLIRCPYQQTVVIVTLLYGALFH